MSPKAIYELSLVKGKVSASHSIAKRAAGDDILKVPDMMSPKGPSIKILEMPKIETPQIKMRKKRQDSNPLSTVMDMAAIPMTVFNDFQKIANSTQTQISKLIPGFGSIFALK